jgi:hypothetical protein
MYMPSLRPEFLLVNWLTRTRCFKLALRRRRVPASTGRSFLDASALRRTYHESITTSFDGVFCCRWRYNEG